MRRILRGNLARRRPARRKALGLRGTGVLKPKIAVVNGEIAYADRRGRPHCDSSRLESVRVTALCDVNMAPMAWTRPPAHGRRRVPRQGRHAVHARRQVGRRRGDEAAPRRGSRPTLPNSTALMFAAGFGWRDGSPLAPSYDQGSPEEAIQAIALMLDFGLDINAANDTGDTALHQAVTGRGSPEIVRFLIARGANLQAQNKAESDAARGRHGEPQGARPAHRHPPRRRGCRPAVTSRPRRCRDAWQKLRGRLRWISFHTQRGTRIRWRMEPRRRDPLHAVGYFTDRTRFGGRWVCVPCHNSRHDLVHGRPFPALLH